MKAIDYYEKYSTLLLDPATTDTACTSLAMDFLAETQQIAETRGVKTVKALDGITNEMNAKWNKLADMLPVPVLKRNGWREFFNHSVKEERR